MSYIVLRDGQKLEVDQIDTLEVALDALAYLDESIIAIEEQIERAVASGDTNSDWVIRTRTALKHRRRARSPLQERIGQLRRAGKAAALSASQQDASARKTAWHSAFVAGVREHLSEDDFRRLSERAHQIVHKVGTAV